MPQPAWQVASPDNPLPKPELRRRLRALRPAGEAAVALSQALRERLTPWLSARPERRIAAFAPLPGEPDLLALAERLPDFHWLLPRVVDGESLAFHRYQGLAELHPGAFGIAEPDPASPSVAITDIDLFLCPGLAFTPSGVRLGRGKGYYDRALAGARPDAVFVGVCFPSQLQSSLPAEAHDRPMHHLATPDGILDCS